MANVPIESVRLTINGRVISDWGDTDPPVEISEAALANIKRGQGGRSVGATIKNQERTLTIHLLLGGEDVAFIEGLILSGSLVCEISYDNLPFNIAGAGQGLLTTTGAISGGGDTPTTDKSYTFALSNWVGT